MSDLAMFIDYGYCTGCQSCMISCKNEKGYTEKPYGVDVLQVGPYELTRTHWEWDYIPAFTDRCDLCAQRIKKGERAACELHCLANCLEVGPVDQLEERLKSASRKAMIVKP